MLGFVGMLGAIACVKLRADRLVLQSVRSLGGMAVTAAVALKLRKNKRQEIEEAPASRFISVKAATRRKLTTEQEKERREKRAKERELYAKQLDAQKLASLQSKLSMLKAHMEVVEENEDEPRETLVHSISKSCAQITVSDLSDVLKDKNGAAVDQLEVIAPGCSSPISEDNLSLSQVATA
mmetsp:Transcript_10769/g.32968  ORF Transcript_10769/g.32968 Transcript_10769/m.32968 type:complete len:181 (+) Transcript_10769:400-942(+)